MIQYFFGTLLALLTFYQENPQTQEHPYVVLRDFTPDGDRYRVMGPEDEGLGFNHLHRRDLPETVRIQNKCSDLFLGIRQAGKDPGEHALQWDRAHDGSQDWLIETRTNEGSVYIRNANSGLYLGVREASAMNGMDIIQWNHADDGSQDWRIITKPEYEGYVAIVNAHNSKYWSIFEASRARGEKLIQWDASGNNDQLWQFVGVEDRRETPIIGSWREPPPL
jgi:hypothetical protein